MRRSFALLLIMVIVVLSAYVTKPSDEKCITEAKSLYRKNITSKIDQGIPSTINKQLFTETLEKVFAQTLKVQDRIVYKEIYQQRGALKADIGWGAFGIVSVDVK